MLNRSVTWDMVAEDAEISLAKFIAELVRQGVNFEAKASGPNYVITFNGGY